MKRIIKQLLVSACAGLALVLPACQKDASEAEMPQWTVKESTLVGTLKESHYTPNEFVDALGSPSMTGMLERVAPMALPWAKALMQTKVLSHLPELDVKFAKECGTSIFDKRCWEIQSYTFSYWSQTVDGREVRLSGRVTFPNNTVENIDHQVKTLTLHTHQALINADCAPSENLMYMPLKALWDSAVIEPDLQEWGITYQKESNGTGSPIAMARQLADCTVAALELMRRYGVTLAPDGYTTTWGSSETAAVPMAFARWYETEAPQWIRDELRLKSSFCGEGVVDLPALLRDHAYLRADKIRSDLPFLADYPNAFSAEQLGGYAPEALFAPKFSDEKVQLPDGRVVSRIKAFSMNLVGLVEKEAYSTLTSFDKIFSPDVLTADGEVNMDSPIIQAWLACAEKNNGLSGWFPQHPVYLAHSPEDEMLPYEITYGFYRRLSDFGQNPSVQMLSVPFIKDIEIGGFQPHNLISFLMLIQMSCAQDPEDMVKIYQPVS